MHTGSVRSGCEAHLFSRTDRLLKRKVALIWPGHKLEQAVTKKTLRVTYFGLFPGSINYGLFDFPISRNNDRSNVRTQYIHDLTYCYDIFLS